MTCAMSVVVPPSGSAVVDAVNVMVDPVGASSGTFSQPIATSEAISRTATGAATAQRRRKAGIMKTLTILVPMHLRGQEKGYAMAVLLVAMSIMAIMMTVAMPVWKQTSQREGRGADLPRPAVRPRHWPVRAEIRERESAQSRRAHRAALSPEEIQGSDHARRFPDDPRRPDVARIDDATGDAGRAGAGQQSAALAAPSTRSAAWWHARRGATGGIVGVVSKSPDRSIRIYNGRTHYNEWAFVYTAPVQAPGGAPGTAAPGQRGQQGQPPATGGQRDAALPAGRGAPNAPPGRGNPNQPNPPRQRTGRRFNPISASAGRTSRGDLVRPQVQGFGRRNVRKAQTPEV